MAAGLTQEDLAAQARLSRNAISALERAERTRPRKDTIHLIALALRLPAEDEQALLTAARARPLSPFTSAWTQSTLALPLPALPARAQPTPLVGREAELETIRRQLVVKGARLLTLTGPAGVGKTRLALAAAADAQVADHFPGGVTVVDLARILDPQLVLSTIARALGLADLSPAPVSQQLSEVLCERTALLVLDNFEQVLPTAASLADLLVACPHVALLVTSRIPLNLLWERTLRVAPLPVPDLRAALPPLDELAHFPSVALFLERARAHRADFALTESDAPLVAQLVSELDGLPLALELAAARLDVLSLRTIVLRLKDRLQLLRWESPDLPERHRSLEAAVSWSYDLLSEPEQRLFRNLGVFVCRVALDAITAVATCPRHAGREGNTLDAMAALAEKSLILPGRPEEDDDDDPEPVFSMLETVREYAREQLACRGELAGARARHAHYFLALAERADPLLRGRDQRAWIFRLEREHDNLRAALRWLLDQDDPAERTSGLRLAAALGYFWLQRGFLAEGWRWLEEALRSTPPAADLEVAADARTRALLGAGAILTMLGELEQANTVLEEALALAQRRQDPAAVAHAFVYMGLCALFTGAWAESARLLREALARCEGLGDLYYSGFALYLLGLTSYARGLNEEAAALQAAALERFEAAGDARLAGNVHIALAAILRMRGDIQCAARHVQRALQTSIALQDRWLLSTDARAAVTLLGACADPAPCARLLGAADALRQATGATLMRDRIATDRAVTSLHDRLDQGEWATAYREGQALHFDAIATLALTLLEEVAQTSALRKASELPQAAQGLPENTQRTQPTQARQEDSLSEREREVLRLVAQGFSNKAIGRQLFISPNTVNYHVSSIFHKLAVDTRAHAVAVAAQRGLL